jgi:multisubunit Na+/H+ antiporter MnhG subunit
MLVGAIMLIIGLSLIIMGVITISTAPDFFEQSSDHMAAFSRGATMAFIGFGLMSVGGMIIYITNIRRVTRYMATETAPAVEIMGDAAGHGLAQGTRSAGGIKIDASGSLGKEVIKVKCRNCGFLDTEDATFCSKCGTRL